MKLHLLTEVAYLIKCFTRSRPAIPQLGNDKLIWLLLQSTDLFKYSSNDVNPLDVIQNILDSQEYLIPLMSSNFVETVYDLTISPHKDCGICRDCAFCGSFVLKKLAVLAESECGKGEIAHKLLRGGPNVKEQLVSVIPYIVS